MSNPPIAPINRVVSASLLIDAAAEALAVIKEQDGLTDAEMGAVMHKSADQAAKYRTSLATMDFIAFMRAASAWNGRFTGQVGELLGIQFSRLMSPQKSARGFAALLAKLQAAVNHALENDDEIDDDELTAMRALLDETGREIDSLLARPKLKAVRS